MWYLRMTASHTTNWRCGSLRKKCGLWACFCCYHQTSSLPCPVAETGKFPYWLPWIFLWSWHVLCSPTFKAIVLTLSASWLLFPQSIKHTWESEVSILPVLCCLTPVSSVGSLSGSISQLVLKPQYSFFHTNFPLGKIYKGEAVDLVYIFSTCLHS